MLLSRPAVEVTATIFLLLAGLYLLAGLVFYVVFLAKGIRRVDESTEGSPKLFFLLILPGTLAFWPVLWRRWRQTSNPEKDD